MALARRALAGFKPAVGSAQLTAWRFGLYLLAMLPGILVTIGHLRDRVGRRPMFDEMARPLELVGVRQLVSELPGPGLGLLLGGLVAIWILQQLWLAGATRVLDPRRREGGPVRRELLEEGARYLVRYLRVVGLALVAVVVSMTLLRLVFEGLADRAEIEGWSIQRSFIDLPVLRALLTLLVLTLIGTAAFWAKVIVSADDRRYVRRLPWIVLRLFLRRPLATLGFQSTTVLLVLALQAAALWSWRQSGTFLPWLFLWLILLMAAAYVWQARVRAAVLVWRGRDLVRLRAIPDAPFGWWRSVAGRFVKGRQRELPWSE